MRNLNAVTRRFCVLAVTSGVGLAFAATADAASPISALYNRTTFSHDGTGIGAFPLSGGSGGFSVEALEAIGLTSGGELSIDGFEYRLPEVGVGKNDALYPDGEQIAPPPVEGANRVGVLAAVGYGSSTLNLTVHYTDGSEQTAPVGVADWFRDGEWSGGRPNGSRPRRSVEAARFPYRNTNTGGRDAGTPYLFSTSTEIDETKTVEWVSFGRTDTRWPYIYSVALASGDPVPLEQAFNENSTGPAPAGGQSLAEFGLDRWAFSQAAMAEAGVAPGATVRSGDMVYTLPNVADDAPDNLDWWGQRVALDAAPGTTRIGLLASAPGGPAFANVTIGYADGSTGRDELVVSDWVLGDMDPPSRNNRVLATFKTRLTPDGTQDVPSRLYSVELPVEPGKQPVWIQVSTPWQDAVHVFALTTTAAPLPGPSGEPLPGEGTDAPAPEIPETGVPWTDTPLPPFALPLVPEPVAAAATEDTPVPAPALAGRARVVVPRAVRVDSRGRVTLKLSCPRGADCRVRPAVSAGGKTSRGTTLTLSAGRSVSTRVMLSARVRRTLKRRGSLAARVSAGGAVVRTVLRSA